MTDVTPHHRPTAPACSVGETRRRWMAVLAKAPLAAIEARLHVLPDRALPAFDHVRRPETGMVMVQGRAGGTGARFNAGEMTVTRCSVALADGTVGHAYVSGRSHRHAEVAAVLDGALQTDMADDLMAQVIEPLERELAAMRERRAREAGATKVEFFTMVRGED
jgi:alpha-D-ribose 1-methylphosphonate 5-triphosphate synthase subunit PhnG